MHTSTNKQGANQMEKTKEYYAGFDAKSDEIKTMGFEAARDKFNLENPPGQKWTGSIQGLNYARGEYQALCDALAK